MPGEHILIVEDERATATYLKELLESYDYRIQDVVHTAEAALDSVKKSQPDLVLMDIMLESEMDGITAGQLIRKKRNIPIIYLSAYCNSELSRRAIASNPDGYILKPFNKKELKVNISLALNRHRQRQSVLENNHWTEGDLKACVECFNSLQVKEDCRIFLDDAVPLDEDRLQRWQAKLKEINVDLGLKIAKRTENLMMSLSQFRKSNDQSKNALQEKETLIREIHHRVKNNLTVLLSLFQLQLSRVSDEKARDAIRNCHNRLHTMLLVHDRLHAAPASPEIDMQRYLAELGDIVLQGSDIVGRIQLSVRAEPITLASRQVSALSLIVNELITNAIKHAFPDNGKGRIMIELERVADNEAQLTFSDNGIGMPENFKLKTTDSLGMRLVRTIAENQLEGSLRMENSGGARVIIRFGMDSQASV